MTAPPLPPEPPVPPEALLQQLSSLADGDVGGLDDGLPAALAAWRLDGSARQAWHTYHLIGDVMRSDDLARPAVQDLAFMSRLRERLDAEPAHFLPASPAPAAAPRAHRVMAWPAGAALAASVAVAAVALLVSRAGAPGLADTAPVLASSDAAGVEAQTLAVNSAGVLRNPRLDEFLRLHQMARGGLPVSAPGGTLQRADLQMPAGPGR